MDALTIAAITIGFGIIWTLGYLTGRVHGVRSGYVRGYTALSDELQENQK